MSRPVKGRRGGKGAQRPEHRSTVIDRPEKPGQSAQHVDGGPVVEGWWVPVGWVGTVDWGAIGLVLVDPPPRGS